PLRVIVEFYSPPSRLQPPVKGDNLVNHTNSDLSRRDMMKACGGLAASAALAGVLAPYVHAGESNTIQLALVGCGGRGTGAARVAGGGAAPGPAGDARAPKPGPTKLVAMPDVSPRQISDNYARLEKHHAKTMDVPKDRQFIGFDAYQKAMDCLKPGDVV